MKKNILFGLMAGALMLASCSDFTDIQPKGKNLLSSTSDLDLLLNGCNNGDYPNDNSFSVYDIRTLGGDVIYSYSNVASAIAVDNPTKNAYLYAFMDEPSDINRFELLSTSDDYYNSCYDQIGRIANPILQQVESATGTEDKKNALKAEALALRAYDHFMILQKYAKAYNPATAAQDGGIVYMKEDDDITAHQPKRSVKEAYEMALADINEALEMNAIPTTQSIVTRINLPAAYAIKAYICMAMRDFTAAEEAAQNALDLDDDLYNYWENVTMEMNYDMMYGFTDDGYYEASTINALQNPECYMVSPDFLYYAFVVPESWDAIEDTYATKDLMPTMAKSYGPIMSQMYASYMNDLFADGWNCGEDFSNYMNISGLASPQMYLLVAECELRAGHIDAAMAKLDELRLYRVNPDVYQPFEGNVTTTAEAIEKVKATSFAENLWNGWNYFSRKRWNVDTEWQTTLQRTIGGITYTLEPNSNLWVFPFPTKVRENNPNLTSNKNN